MAVTASKQIQLQVVTALIEQGKLLHLVLNT